MTYCSHPLCVSVVFLLFTSLFFFFNVPAPPHAPPLPLPAPLPGGGGGGGWGGREGEGGRSGRGGRLLLGGGLSWGSLERRRMGEGGTTAKTRPPDWLLCLVTGEGGGS